ncbi:MAG TPA: hypothetical protein VK425_08185 [Acidimicrobiales bacterium]|nr:hypothetical protein [Acidimicrobiales bacterium]
MKSNETGARRPWFGPKWVGYGLSPKAWQGWVVLGLVVALVALIRMFVF